MKPIVKLLRLKRSDQGTLGMVLFEDFKCYSLELPWRNNRQNISCIPSGIYQVEIRISPKYGKVYWVKNVPDRSWILIHSGNWAGDRNKGYRTHVNGCILFGANRGLLDGQLAVLNSRITIRRFMDVLNNEPFTLEIHEEF
jgi:hypothetical protein